MDRIYIQSLSVPALIGVYDWERTSKSRLLADITMFVDLRKAQKSDDVNDTVDYAKVAECVQDVADRSAYQLLEALAGDMIANIFSRFAVSEVHLTLSKPDILDDAQNVSVELRRKAPLR